mgnify:FL=1
MSINVCVPGVSGKMGMEIAKLILLDESDIVLSSGVIRDQNINNDKFIKT